MIELALAALLFQRLEAGTTFSDFGLKDSEIARAAAQTKQTYIAIERRDFANRFDGLIGALRAFEVEYRKNAGAVWPKKQADELYKAIRRLESTEAWKHYRKPHPGREFAQQ
jgi:hypothetical protein